MLLFVYFVCKQISGNWHKGNKNGHGVEVTSSGKFEGEWKEGMVTSVWKKCLLRLFFYVVFLFALMSYF